MGNRGVNPFRRTDLSQKTSAYHPLEQGRVGRVLSPQVEHPSEVGFPMSLGNDVLKFDVSNENLVFKRRRGIRGKGLKKFCSLIGDGEGWLALRNFVRQKINGG